MVATVSRCEKRDAECLNQRDTRHLMFEYLGNATVRHRRDAVVSGVRSEPLAMKLASQVLKRLFCAAIGS